MPTEINTYKMIVTTYEVHYIVPCVYLTGLVGPPSGSQALVSIGWFLPRQSPHSINVDGLH